MANASLTDVQYFPYFIIEMKLIIVLDLSTRQSKFLYKNGFWGTVLVYCNLVTITEIHLCKCCLLGNTLKSKSVKLSKSKLRRAFSCVEKVHSGSDRTSRSVAGNQVPRHKSDF